MRVRPSFVVARVSLKKRKTTTPFYHVKMQKKKKDRGNKRKEKRKMTVNQEGGCNKNLIMSLRFPTSRTVRNKGLLFKLSAYVILFQQLELSCMLKTRIVICISICYVKR
jgi:hypothetical protein